MIEEYHVEFVSSTEKFDTSTPIGRAMLNICIVFAQLERETIQKRVTDAYYARNKRGFYMGGRIPYGYRLKETIIDNIRTSMYEEVPEESEQLKLIYSLYADPANSLGDIIRYLNKHGIKQLRGGNWTSARIREILYMWKLILMCITFSKVKEQMFIIRQAILQVIMPVTYIKERYQQQENSVTLRTRK